MPVPDHTVLLEEQIKQWRSYLRRRQAINVVDVIELEDHLREQVAALIKAGLTTDEAFLVAVKRIGSLDDLSREFAREHSDRLWKQLVIASPDDSSQKSPALQTNTIITFCLAVATALAIKMPVLFGLELDQDAGFYVRNLSFFVLPFLTGYFVWKRRLNMSRVSWMTVAFLIAAFFANVYPFVSEGYTEMLTAIHLPIALWLVVGISYAGDRWSGVNGRMDFIRFSGELFIYYVLIALGGGVLTGLMVLIFKAIGIDATLFFSTWLLPCGAAGAVFVTSWLVEAKQSVIENMAPVLTRLFTPLFAAVLLAFLATMLWTGHGVDIERNALIAFDLLLVVVLGLLLYSVSARDPKVPPDYFDVLQVVLLVSALLADAVALLAIATRISELGFTPNRVAALGENVILLANLAWSTTLYINFLRGHRSFMDIVQWQTDYLYVYAAWGAIVVIVFPPLFGYI
jgi:hypothetical protein